MSSGSRFWRAALHSGAEKTFDPRVPVEVHAATNLAYAEVVRDVWPRERGSFRVSMESKTHHELPVPHSLPSGSRAMLHTYTRCSENNVCSSLIKSSPNNCKTLTGKRPHQLDTPLSAIILYVSSPSVSYHLTGHAYQPTIVSLLNAIKMSPPRECTAC